MKWFINLQSSRKLSIVFGAMVLLIVIIALIGQRTIDMMWTAHLKFRQQYFMTVQDLALLESHENAIRLALVNLSYAKTEASKETWFHDLKNQSAEIEKLFPRIIRLLQKNRNLSQKLTELNNIRIQNREVRDEHVVPLLMQGKKAEADVFQSAQEARFINMRMIIESLLRDSENQLNTAILETQHEASMANNIFIFICALSIVFSSLMIRLLNNIMAKPLKKISLAAEKISKGDLDVTIERVYRKDEVGVLYNTFFHMIESLKAMADVARRIADGDLIVKVSPFSTHDILSNSFNMMLTNLRAMATELNEAINMLGSTSREILSSTSQLVGSSSEIASSITETTTTLEEIRQTAQLANQKANTVATTAHSTELVYQDGRKASEDASEGITRIHNQMETIARSMFRLSEQTQAVGGLIGVVDDLAQQSNLLAVNAAIEAAKAGEQGRGFAVVAQEVKSLADQSKQATNQVRMILNDIQKATNAAVLATEEGAKAVDSGLKKSVEAGKSITALGSNLSESAETATQIAATSHQQLLGMEQSTIAMENIKQSSIKNAASAKELESSAQAITRLGLKLKELITIYKLK